jgi:TPR repeat protein
MTDAATINYMTLSPNELKKLAEKGDSDAQIAYADHLHRSWGSKEEQLKWLSAAYMQGNPIASWKIGCLYEDSYHDAEMAMLWYERSAENGFSLAMMSIVQHYLAKRQYDSLAALKAGYETAYVWLIKATQLGNAHAYRLFADLCFFGVHVEQDYTQAIRYYERAAELGEDMACVMLTYCYRKGKGVRRDRVKQKYWFARCRKINLRIPLRHHLSSWKRVAKRFKGSYQLDCSDCVL